MALLHASIWDEQFILPALVIAAVLVTICLRAICQDLDHAMRVNTLKTQTRQLRQQQARRVRELDNKFGPGR